MIKLLKQLFPFIFASILLPQNKTKTNAKFNNFFKRAHPNYNYNYNQNHPNINNQPQIN